MKIQAINRISNVSSIKSNKRIENGKMNANSVAFNGKYETVMKSVVYKDLKNLQDVNAAAIDLFKALIYDHGKSPAKLSSLQKWFYNKPIELMQELSRKECYISPSLKYLILAIQDKDITLFDNLYIQHVGVHNFWEAFFDEKQAINNVKFEFWDKERNFAIGTNSDGRIITEQMYRPNWIKNTYSLYKGDRIKHKTGTYDNTIVWPAC